MYRKNHEKFAAAVGRSMQPPLASLPVAGAASDRYSWLIGGAVATTIVLWASAFVGIRVALKGYTPVQLAALRYLVAALILGIRAFFRRVPIPERRDWLRIILSSFLGFVVYATLLNYGETRVAAGLASFIVYTVPLITAILSSLFLHERMGRLGWLGLATSLGGTGLIAFTTGQRLSFEPAVLALLAAAFALALHFILQKPLTQRYGAFTITSWAVWVSTVALLPVLPLKELSQVPLSATISVVYLGVLPTVVAYSTWAYAVARMPVARTTTCLYFIPGIATVIGFVLLGERPASLAILGGIVAIGGVVLVNFRKK